MSSQQLQAARLVWRSAGWHAQDVLGALQCVAGEACLAASDTKQRSNRHSVQQQPFGLLSPAGSEACLPAQRSLSSLPGTASTSGLQQLPLSTQKRGFFRLPSRYEIMDPDRSATNLMLAVNTAVFIMAKFNRPMVQAMAQVPQLVAQGEYYRLLTAGFLHLDFFHFLGSALSLHWLGPQIERHCGATRFAVVYLSSILCGGFMQYHFGNPMAVSIGASGGIYGLFAALLVFKWRNRAFMGGFTSGDWSWIGQVVALNVVLALMMGGSIGHWSHFGGFLGGAATMYLFGPRYRWRNGYTVDAPLLPFFKDMR